MPALLPILLNLLGFFGGSALGGMAGAKLGPKIGPLAGKALGPKLGGLLGSAAGPVGNIAGGIAGSVLLPYAMGEDEANAGVEDKLDMAAMTTNNEAMRSQQAMDSIASAAELEQALEMLGISMEDLNAVTGGGRLV